MITGQIRNQVDRLWHAVWAGGIANPLEVIDQITYLLFIKRLDELQTLEERRAAAPGRPLVRHTFPGAMTPPDPSDVICDPARGTAAAHRRLGRYA